MQNFKKYVYSLLHKHKNERVYCFEYLGQKYWLKQVEGVIKGGFLTKLFKPNPFKAFQKEISALKYLNEKKAPVPELVMFDKDFFVLKDAGRTVDGLIKYGNCEKEKQLVLGECAKALANLHKIGLVHGRPAVRDMAWKDGKIKFIDFESKFLSENLNLKKSRDLLIFIHDLYRLRTLNQNQIEKIVKQYILNDGLEIWNNTLKIVYHWRFLYYVLLPFKFSNKKDLIAGIKLFEYLLPQARIAKKRF